MWTYAQRSPPDQVHYEKIGKARAFLDHKAKSFQPTAYAKCSYKPHWVFTCYFEEAEMEMGCADDKGDAGWNEENTQRAFNLNSTAMNKEMWTFKRA